MSIFMCAIVKIVGLDTQIPEEGNPFSCGFKCGYYNSFPDGRATINHISLEVKRIIIVIIFLIVITIYIRH